MNPEIKINSMQIEIPSGMALMQALIEASKLSLENKVDVIFEINKVRCKIHFEKLIKSIQEQNKDLFKNLDFNDIKERYDPLI